MTPLSPELPFPAEEFRKLLVSWFRKEGKDYPWRRTSDPWAILVSEIMLQQTTVPTILKRYEKWLEQFPSPQALADADEDTVLRSWEGLGYYQRVRNLQKTAQALVTEYGGILPNSVDKLRSLTGIGPYTAAAVASFAFHLPEPLVDANVSRVFSRLFDDDTPVDSPEGIKMTARRAELLMDRDNPHDYNSGLMELGQNYCKKIPDCLLCPVSSVCTTRRAVDLPVKLPKKTAVLVTEHALFARNATGAILLAKTAGGRRREGLWRLPLREETELDDFHKIASHKFNITHHKVTQHIYSPSTGSPLIRENEKWVSPELLDNTPLASPDRKMLNKLLSC